MTVDEARVRATLANPDLHRGFDAEFAEWLARKKAAQLARRRARAVRMRRLQVRDPLPLARVWMRGPRWQRAFDVQSRPNADGVRWWWYDFEADVRELVLEELRPGVVAEWSDPFESFGLQRPRAPPGSRS